MELKEAIKILKERCAYYKKVDECGFDHNQEHLALDTVLKVLDMPEEEVVFYGTRSAGKTVRRTYEMGLIVGTKRERVYWENRINEKLKETCKTFRKDRLPGYQVVESEIRKFSEELLKGE